jgi:uncharacterized membrane protein YkgB
MPPVPPEYFRKSERANIVDGWVGKLLCYIIIMVGCLLISGLWQLALGMGMGLMFSVISYYTGKKVAVAKTTLEEDNE